MSNNYVLLEKVTVSAAGASSIAFTNIPQNYTDLQIVLSSRAASGGAVSAYIATINGSSYTGTLKFVNTDGGTVYSGSTVPYSVGGSSYTSNTFTSTQFYIPNYNSSAFKSISIESAAENNATGTAMFLTSYLAQVTAPITAISFSCDNSFVQHTTAYLYGVAKFGVTPTIQPYATGGDTIMSDGSFWYHAFRSSGTFTPLRGITCDVLTVAGGGAGSGSAQFWAAGGGGAGGVLLQSSRSLVTTNYTVTIGAGGAGNNSSDVDTATSGSNSQFGSLSPAIFGLKGGTLNGPGFIGPCGSSGGNIGDYRTGWAVPTPGQGNRGGYSSFPGGHAAGGGGGAGAIGSDAVTIQSGGAGGLGTNSYSSWLTTTGTGVSGYIGGGGAGGGAAAYGTVVQAIGGLGGGGNGGTLTSTGVTSGVINTGGGGGGAAGTHPSAAPPVGIGGNGGSGLVIVRYPV